MKLSEVPIKQVLGLRVQSDATGRIGTVDGITVYTSRERWADPDVHITWDTCTGDQHPDTYNYHSWMDKITVLE